MPIKPLSQNLMKLPVAIKSRHKIRDSKILSLYRSGETMESIAAKFGFTRSRIGQIIYENSHLLELDLKFERAKRINAFIRLHSKLEGVISKGRDEIDILEQLRKEVEGDKITQVNPIQINFINVKHLESQPLETLIDSYRSLSQDS